MFVTVCLEEIIQRQGNHSDTFPIFHHYHLFNTNLFPLLCGQLVFSYLCFFLPYEEGRHTYTHPTHLSFLFIKRMIQKKEIFTYFGKIGGKRISRVKHFKTSPLCEAGLAGLRSNWVRMVSSWVYLWEAFDFSYLDLFVYSLPSLHCFESIIIHLIQEFDLHCLQRADWQKKTELLFLCCSYFWVTVLPSYNCKSSWHNYKNVTMHCFLFSIQKIMISSTCGVPPS